MSTESQDTVLSKTYELHKAELERLKADYTRELNAKLEQINKQAETILSAQDTLQEVRQDLLSYMAGVGYSSNIVNKIDDALAKVKEGKC